MPKIDEETLNDFQNGFQEEHYLVSAIKKYLLKPNQRQQMFQLDLSIEDILNGRTTGEHQPFIEELFKDWNSSLGFACFRG